MYTVTQSYLDAVRAPSRTDRLTGVLRYPDGSEVELTESLVSLGTVSIKKSCAEGEELQFGAAILGQLKLSLITDRSRYAFLGAVVEPIYGVLTNDGSWADIPLGVYTVGETERKNKTVQLVAYDNLLSFDKDYDGTAIYGTPFELLTLICDKCGVELGMTEEEILSFPNGDQALQIDQTTGCATYRDCLKTIAQMLACFCAADQTGKLVLKRYGKETVTTLTKNNRFSTKVADYVCQYAGVTVNASGKSYSSYDESVSSGLELILQDAPAWDYGTDETLQARTNELMAELAQISYTPATLSISNDPSIECGDMVGLVTDDGTVTTLVTGYVWRYRARMKINSVGKNPYLKSFKPQKGQLIRELEKQTEYNKLIFYSFSNPTALTVSGSEVEPIANVTFVTVEDTSAMFLAQLPLTVEVADVVTESEEEKTVTVKDSTGAETTILDADGNPLTLTVLAKNTDTKPGTVDVEIFYYLDGSLVDYTLVERLTNGPHILSLFYPFSGLKGNQNYTWDVRIRAASGSVTIAKNALKATITGQGLAATTVWDGNLSFEEVVPALSLRSKLSLVAVTEAVSTETQIPTGAAITEKVATFGLRSRLGLGSISERISATEIREKKTIDTAEWEYSDDRYVVIEGSSLMARVEWSYQSEEQTIDSGRMAVVKAVTADLGSVESVEVST